MKTALREVPAKAQDEGITGRARGAAREASAPQNEQFCAAAPGIARGAAQGGGPPVTGTALTVGSPRMAFGARRIIADRTFDEVRNYLLAARVRPAAQRLPR